MNSELIEKTVEYVETLKQMGVEDVLLDARTRKALENFSRSETKKSNVVREGIVMSKPRDLFEETVMELSGDVEADMEKLLAKVLPCRRCEHLTKTRKNVVFGAGNPRAKIMFVGEAPGADEDDQGEPFVGRAGQLLTKMIEAMGLKRKDVYIGNILKCRPDMPANSSGNRKPTVKEMETCLPYLRVQIQIIQPKVMVALGATAVDGLLGNLDMPMKKIRGIWQEFEGIPVMPTYHPAYLLRNQSVTQKRIVWEDLLQVMEKTGMEISERQRNFFLKKA
jgi:DNA polymerase